MLDELAHHIFTNGSVPCQMDSMSHFVFSIISSSWHVLIKYADNLTIGLIFINKKNYFLPLDSIHEDEEHFDFHFALYYL